MECIDCTQCIDACDAVMEQVGKPRGLIRYTSQDALAGKPPHLLRPRTVLYPLALRARLRRRSSSRLATRSPPT